ncbi:MAG: GYF domain-containing protein [bacterium]
MEEQKYFIAIANKRFGPYDLKTIKMLIEKRRYTENDFVWIPETKQWVKAYDFPPFRAIFTPTIKDRGEYFVNIKDEVKGPMHFDELKAMITAGEINPDDSIWDIHRGVWIKADKMPEVAPLFATIKKTLYHISIGGKSAGPYTKEEIEEMFRSGEITIESYIFGGNTWQKLKDCTDFLHLIPPSVETLPPTQKEILTPPSNITSTIPPPGDLSTIEDELLDEGEIKLEEELPTEILPEKKSMPSIELEELVSVERPESTENTKEILEEKIGMEREKDILSQGKIKKERNVPDWLKDYQTYKIDVNTMKLEEAYTIPSSMIDENTIETQIKEYDKFTVGKRLFAAFVDLIILFIGFFTVSLILTAMNIDPFFPANPHQYEDQITLTAVYGAFFLFYLLFRDGFTSNGSIGKKISGIILIQRKNRRPCGIVRSFLRNIIWLIPPFNIIDLLIVFLSRGGRRIGDAIAGTEIIETPLEGHPF